MTKETFDIILKKIGEEGLSLRKAIKSLDKPISSRTFYEYISSDSELQKHYARACEERADFIFEEIFDIADDNTRDVKIIDTKFGEVETTDNDVIQRAKLRVDARKWALAKMYPKKYGDTVDVTTGGDKINEININNRIV